VDIADGVSHLICTTLQKDGNGTIYVDGVAASPGSMAALGKMYLTSATIGARSEGAYPFNGLIGEFLFVRFTSLPSDIADFIADCNTNGIPSKESIEERYAANGASVNAHYQFKGDTDAKMLADVSGTGNNLTGNNVTQADDQVDGDYRSLNGTYLIGRDDATKIVLIPGDTPTSPFRIRADMECPISNAISISSTTATCADWHLIGMKFSLSGDKKIYLYLDGSEVTYSEQIAGT
jgi:hypothetical protein